MSNMKQNIGKYPRRIAFYVLLTVEKTRKMELLHTEIGKILGGNRRGQNQELIFGCIKFQVPIK